MHQCYETIARFDQREPQEVRKLELRKIIYDCDLMLNQIGRQDADPRNYAQEERVARKELGRLEQ